MLYTLTIASLPNSLVIANLHTKRKTSSIFINTGKHGDRDSVSSFQSHVGDSPVIRAIWRILAPSIPFMTSNIRYLFFSHFTTNFYYFHAKSMSTVCRRSSSLTLITGIPGRPKQYPCPHVFHVFHVYLYLPLRAC